MGEVTIQIKNCNCIKEANIKIEEGKLNIKYGSNRTGKSTISKAVFLKTHGKDGELQTLLLYGADETKKSEVNGIAFNKVMLIHKINQAALPTN